MRKVGLRLAGVMSLIAVLLIATPPIASAATFTVNQAGPSSVADISGAVNGVCDASGDPGTQCTLREALNEANAASNNDTINFSSSVFDGDATDVENYDSVIELGGVLTVTKEVTINGRNCASSGTAKPCVGLDLNGGSGLTVAANGVDLRGLDIYGGNSGPDIGISIEGDGATVKGSWIGPELDGVPSGNTFGIVIEGDNATIGGTTGADRNLFGNNGDWLTIRGGDDNRIRGNYFGVLADGTSAAGTTGTAITIESDGADDAVGNVIGRTVSSSATSSTTCDGGCNVIANAADGIDVGSASPGATNTVIKGNYIGLDKTGLIATGNDFGIRVGGGSQGTTIGGDTSAQRNFVTGGTVGIAAETGNTGVALKRNFIGLDATGATNEPPNSIGVSVNSQGIAPATIARNRIDASVIGLLLDGAGLRAIRNKIGVPKTGAAEGPGTCILAQAFNSTIGEPGAGNTIGNCGDGIQFSHGNYFDGGDDNRIQGNYIGTDPSGAILANTGYGIIIPAQTTFHPDDNRIGGDSSAAENVISNSGSDAIAIEDPESVGHRIKRNRGKNNGNDPPDGCNVTCELFLDLDGDNGFGNDSGPNNAIGAPTITNDQPSDVTRSHIEGSGAKPNAQIYIFRTSGSADFSPSRINAFVKRVTAGSGGNFSAGFSTIPSGQRLTVLQLDATDGSSELALTVDPVVAP